MSKTASTIEFPPDRALPEHTHRCTHMVIRLFHVFHRNERSLSLITIKKFSTWIFLFFSFIYFVFSTYFRSTDISFHISIIKKNYFLFFLLQNCKHKNIIVYFMHSLLYLLKKINHENQKKK